jgi:hypothetical protein
LAEFRAKNGNRASVEVANSGHCQVVYLQMLVRPQG